MKWKKTKIDILKSKALETIESRERGRISIKGAIKKDMSYKEVKQWGIKIRKQNYYTLKRIYKGQDLTEGQKKAVEGMKKNKEWAEIVGWAEKEGEKKKKKKYIKLEGTVIISGGYVARDRKKRKNTRVYYEYVIDVIIYADAERETEEDAEIRAEQTITHNFRKAVLEFLKGSELQKGAVSDVRVEWQDDIYTEKTDELGSDEANIIEDSFIIEKWNNREYDYTDEITDKFKSLMGEDLWKA